MHCIYPHSSILKYFRNEILPTFRNFVEGLSWLIDTIFYKRTTFLKQRILQGAPRFIAFDLQYFSYIDNYLYVTKCHTFSKIKKCPSAIEL